MLELCYKTFSQDVTETKINIFMQQEKERHSRYRRIGGWKTIEKQIVLSDPDDIKNYFDTVKNIPL